MGLRMVGGEVVDDDVIRLRITFSEEAEQIGVGRYRSVDYITKKAPGCRDFMSKPATDEDKKAYPKEWADYQGGMQGDDKNTSLTMLPAFKTAFALELKIQGVESIEELAARPEPDGAHLIPIWKQARRYIQLLEDDNAVEEREL